MISSEALIVNSEIGPGAKIFKHAEIKNSSLDRDVIVGNNALVIDSRLESNISINRSNYIFKSEIGRFTYTGIGTSIRSAKVGRFCSLAWNVSIGGGNHEFDHVTTSPFWRFAMLDEGNMNHEYNVELNKRYDDFGSCEIGHDVWIATNAIILRNVKIGNGSIIGAGSVVTKDVEPYTIVAGTPAKKIRSRFDKSLVEALEEIQWWNWPIDLIRSNAEIIYQKKVDQKVIDQMKEIGSSLSI